MKTLLKFIALLGLTILFIQHTHAQIVWKGGSPGQEAQWNEPANWSQHRIPGAGDIVIIPNTGGKYDPFIDQATAPIYYLQVQGGASLHISPNGTLILDGGSTPEDGILLVGDLINEGEIIISSISSPPIVGHPENIYSTGQITYMQNESQDK